MCVLALDRNYCVLFDDYFGRWATRIAKEEHKPLADHVTRSWLGAFNDLQKLCAIIESGQVKLIDFDELQTKYFGGQFAKLFNEIRYVCDYFKIPSFDKRMHQSN